MPSKMEKFPCTKCGLCCLNLNKSDKLSDYHSGNGICIFYEENIGCKIYERRPNFCRIDDGYINFFSELMSRNEYYKKNAQVCNQLQIEENVGKEFRVFLTSIE